MYPDNFSTRNLTPSSTSSRWNRCDDKLFEKALVIFPDHLPDRWPTIAEHLGRSVEEVKEHYEILVHDVFEIDAGRVALPNYADDDLFESSWDSQMTDSNQISFSSSKSKQTDPERKKGTPWTPQEHKLFLIGLRQYGKGDWRSISRNVVVTRTPTQVASHAQKYFLRQNSVKKERKRSSIHDITTVAVDNNSVDQNWIAPPPQSSLVLPNQGPSMDMEYQNYGFPN